MQECMILACAEECQVCNSGQCQDKLGEGEHHPQPEMAMQRILAVCHCSGHRCTSLSLTWQQMGSNLAHSKVTAITGTGQAPDFLLVVIVVGQVQGLRHSKVEHVFVLLLVVLYSKC
jgi:hypothetical protein